MPNRVKFCGRCGTEIPEGDLFCSSCGHELGQKAAVPAPEPDGTSASETPIAESPSKSGKRPWYKRRAIVLPIAVLVAAILLVVLFVYPEDNSGSVAPSAACLADANPTLHDEEESAFTSCTSVEELVAALTATLPETLREFLTERAEQAGEDPDRYIQSMQAIPVRVLLTRCEHGSLMNTPLCEAHATTTTTTVVSFDSVDWHSFYDWCLDHKVYRGVDCEDRADDLQEWVNEYPEFEYCGLKAAKYYVVKATSDFATRWMPPIYYGELRACRGVEGPSPVATTAAPVATTAAP